MAEGRMLTVYAARVVGPRKSPWWQFTKTPRTGFILGGFYVLISVLRLVFGLVDNHWPWWDVWLTVAFALLGVAYLASAIAMANSASLQDPGPGTR